jgi:hypothetical protein
MEKTFSKRIAVLVAAAFLAACGSSGSSGGGGGGNQVTRGEISALSAGSITVNGVRLSTDAGTAVKVDDSQGGLDDLRLGAVVTVSGAFDDRGGRASEIRLGHEIEGRVDDKGTDFLVIGGVRVQVDDSTQFGEDNPARLDDVPVGSFVGVSGVPVGPSGSDDKGGLRASRIDDSPLTGDSFDVKGFVSNLSGGTFELRVSPDAIGHYLVDASGLGTVAGLSDGAYVEAHAASPLTPGSPPVIASFTASAIEIEDRFGQAEIEIEGYVSSLSASKDAFFVDGVPVRTGASTRYALGVKDDLVDGAKVEVEGRLDDQGVLAARKVSFRPGARITAVVSGFTGTDMILLGIPVQLPSFLRDDLGAALDDGVKVEVRGNPSASGQGVVAHRIKDPTGNDDRVFIRAIATAKSDAGGISFDVMGFTVTPKAGATLRLASGTPGVSAATFYAAVEPGRTVLKVRADTVADVDVGAKTWQADEIEIEGRD